MKFLKKLSIFCAVMFSFYVVSPVFAVTAVIDVDKVLYEYTKARETAEQFKAKDQQLRQEIVEAQNKVRAAKTPVEKKNLEETYQKQLSAKADKLKADEIKQLQALETDIMNTINKINSNGKYDLILKKSATVYCKNDITDEVLKKLNSKY